jgi:hypothetical protein
MNVLGALQPAAQPVDGDAATARSGMKQAWMRSLEQAWKRPPGSVPDEGRAGNPASQAAPERAASLTAVDAVPAADLRRPIASAALHETRAAAPEGAQRAAPLCPAPASSGRAALPPFTIAAPMAGTVVLPFTLEPAGAPARPAEHSAATPREPLPQRTLLTLPEGDGLAVWIRDGQLAESDGRRLADSLRRAAREAGMNLRRVAVNGHAVFEAADAASLLTFPRR